MGLHWTSFVRGEIRQAVAEARSEARDIERSTPSLAGDGRVDGQFARLDVQDILRDARRAVRGAEAEAAREARGASRGAVVEARGGVGHVTELFSHPAEHEPEKSALPGAVLEDAVISGEVDAWPAKCLMLLLAAASGFLLSYLLLALCKFMQRPHTRRLPVMQRVVGDQEPSVEWGKDQEPSIE
ncbi:unnamed protein product [Polarella glacialis]|uniref:Uncharacterized protein n=1 Tax=Polarella glacialis TaxID=89957 RepID=A0A813EP21_POLGL|nr:unnamed protein product [Polarella glacialis]